MEDLVGAGALTGDSPEIRKRLGFTWIFSISRCLYYLLGQEL